MIRRIFLLPFLLVLLAGPQLLPAQNAEIVKIDYLKKILDSKEDKNYVINFWATWCRPCVKELPYFEKMNGELEGKNAEVILVSLDFSENLDDKLIPFIKRKKLQSTVVLLDEMKYNDWIPVIDDEWDGAIPVTLVVNPAQGYRAFYNHDFESYQELEEILDPIKGNL